MRFEITVYMAVQSVSALVSLSAAAIAWRGRRAPGGLLFALMMTAVTIWTFSVSLEEGVTELAAKILLSKISYVGLANIGPLFLLFSLKHRDGGRRMVVPAALIWAVPAAALALTATNELHGLIWTSVTPAASPARNLAVYAHGPAWWAFCAYELLLVSGATAHFGRTAVRAPRAYVRETAVLAAAVAVVWAAFALYVAPGNPVPGFNLPAASFAVSGSLILWAMTRRKLFVLSPIAREALVEAITMRRRAEEASRESERDLRSLLLAAQRHAKELELLDQVRTSLASELDLSEIFRTVVEGIARVFGYTQVTLYIAEDGQLTLRHQVGYSNVIGKIPTTRGITGRVYRTGVATLVQDVRKDPDFIGAIQGVVSEVCVPLFDQGVSVGVLNVESIGGVTMGPEDLRLMTILGEHVSIALSKARLYTQARENEDRYRTLVAALGEGVGIVDGSECFEFANPAAEAIFGVPPGGLAGRSLAEFLSPEEFARSQGETKRRRRGESSIYEQVIRRPDGETRQIELIATPRRDPGGKVTGTLGIFRDVTELRLLQKRLEQERALLLTLIDSLPDYVYLKDSDGRFILTNKAQALVVGARDSSELVGRTDADFVPRELAERYRAMDLQVMQSGRPVVNIEEPAEAAGGDRRRVLTTKVPIFDAAGSVTGLVGISRDVTDLARAEEEREKLQEQLLQSQKMEAVGRLAGGIAHDFNNILTVITGYTEMALEESRGSPALKGSLEEIKRAARRSATLVSQLLAFSRRQILLPRVFDLAELVDGMGGMLRRLLGEDVRLVTARTEPSLQVDADPGRIEQVIMNLAVNSRDAMPDGGLLTIQASAARLSAEELTGHPEVVPGEYVSLSVSDTGHGMDAQTMSRLFEPFFTTKEVGKGTGLGLATVYGIVRQSAGHITCRSEPGRGATFTVYLPRVKGRPPGASATAEGTALRTHGTEQILLVEDDEPVRRYVGSILETAGYTVIAAESGHDALERLGSLPQPPHLLLTDVVMPGMDGRVLAQQVTRHFPGIPVVFMSGYADIVPGVSGLSDPDRALIQKPFSSDDLLRTIRASLEGRGKRD